MGTVQGQRFSITRQSLFIHSNITIITKPPYRCANREGQYADDMFTITTNIEEKERLKIKLQPQLKKFNIGVNETKTEDYKIS